MDFRYSRQGSACFLEPLSEEAYRWLVEYIGAEAYRVWLGRSMVLEPEHAPHVLCLIGADGLEVQR